jgi:hypothetical protein
MLSPLWKNMGNLEGSFYISSFCAVAPEIRKFARFSKFSVQRMHHITINCVAYGYPEVRYS